MTSLREYIFFDSYKAWRMDDCSPLSYSELQVNYWVASLACLGMANARTFTLKVANYYLNYGWLVSRGNCVFNQA